jgi:hypothetical protein
MRIKIYGITYKMINNNSNNKKRILHQEIE